MKKYFFLLSALLCLGACKLHDDYTGEPFVRLEYTLDNEHTVYEDWGRMLGTAFGPVCSGSLQTVELGQNESIVRFSLYSPLLELVFDNDRGGFTDGRRYDYSPYEWSEPCVLYSEQAKAIGGWYIFTKKVTEPYCPYEVHFELTFSDGKRNYELTDGCIQMGRRMRGAGSKSLIKKPGEL